MAPFYPLYIRRSDGKIEVKPSKNAKSELNEPMPEQLDSKPNEQGVSDFYRQCRSGDAKEIDWRRKLAGMLMREIGKKDNSNRNFILASLPENYRLYEHVKCKASDADGTPAEKSTKTHAAGGNERQDAYLYGHPQGRKKRYRSPAEFFPHLLWLATDEAGDPNNCGCKFCSPEELEGDEKPSAKNAPKDSKTQAIKPASNSNTPNAGVTIAATTKASPASQALATAAAAPATGQRSAPNNVQITPPSVQPMPLPSPRSQEQFQDTQYGAWLYRLGEIVWFSRGTAWGLGVVAGRESIQPPQQHYHVQPLSHPFDSQRLILLKQHQLRPWLAWSPPPCTSKDLNPSQENGNRISTYDNVDWQRALAGGYGQGNAEVDASILSVKAVELTYTPIDFAPERSQPSESHYNGVYFGGEKVWVGDPVRLRRDNATDILVVYDIIEKPNQQDLSRPFLSFVGDIYSYQTKDQGRSVPYENLLPQRVLSDLQFRNNVSMGNPDLSQRFSCYWCLVEKLAIVDAGEIKGRWYESSLASPVLDRAAFDDAMRNHNVPDTALYMNGQGDCNRYMDPAHPDRPFTPAQVRKATREEAFGRSVPSRFQIAGAITSSQAQSTTQSAEQPRHPSQSPHISQMSRPSQSPHLAQSAHPSQSPHLSRPLHPSPSPHPQQQTLPSQQGQQVPQNGYVTYQQSNGQPPQGFPQQGYQSIYENGHLPPQ